MTDKPGVDQDHRRVHESAGVRQRNDAEIYDQKSYVAIDLGKQQVAGSHQQHRSQHDRLGSVAIEQMTDDGTFDGAFGAREREGQGRGGSI